jgi:hypothetical protein
MKMKQTRRFKVSLYYFALICLIMSLSSPLHAAAPDRREQISLNGTWDNGGVVPNYDGIKGFKSETYQRTVTAPASWAGKVIQLEFGAVNFIAQVFVNGKQLIEHVGGWSPFEVDVTNHITAGQPFVLKVVVHGPKTQPIFDDKGAAQWPVGGWSNRGGIADDVWLRAYGKVHVEDAFIQTSYRQQTLTIDYSLLNTDSVTRTVSLSADAMRAGKTEVEKNLRSSITLAPGERKTIRVSDRWSQPTLYWPDSPSLYHLRTTLRDGDAVVDAEMRRFGFREIWIEGNQFKWNGVRINLFGDYQSVGDTYYTKPEFYHPQNWPSTVDQIKAMNIRILRFHHNPVPQYILDVCDEKGLLVCDESANYARSFHKETNQTQYLVNAKETIGPWIKADRNHPSIYMWNATNEMTYSQFGGFKAAAVAEIGEVIKSFDPTRPVGYDGDSGRVRRVDGASTRVETGIRGSELIDYHYPEGYNKEPVGSIYGWAHLVSPDKPTGAGEALHTKSPLPEVQKAVERNTWWLGIWSRGMRYTNWTNWKPGCWWFTSNDLASDNPAQRQRSLNLRNAYAPVALFDKAYDDLGIAPYVTGTTPGGVLPTVRAGEKQQRTLILYNDEFRDTTVAVEVLLKAGDKVYGRAKQTFHVGLGEHIEFPCTFIVPDADGQTLELVLQTFKGGTKKFEEARRFTVVGTAPDRKLSPVELGAPVKP